MSYKSLRTTTWTSPRSTEQSGSARHRFTTNPAVSAPNPY